MYENTINVLRRQFLGLNRVLSTVTELITDGLMYDDDKELLNFAAKLLVTNHNFQFCTIHIMETTSLELVAALSTESIMQQCEADKDAEWIRECELLACKMIEKNAKQVVEEKLGDNTYYMMPLLYRDEAIGILTVISPGNDDDQSHMISVFSYMLTSLIMNSRQNHRLNLEVRRRTEELKIAWQEAQSSSDAKTQFLTNMSHEFLTPLNAIIGASSLISETQLNPEQSDYIKSVLESSTNLHTMVNDMLDLSLVDAEQLEFHHQLTDLHQLLKAVHQKYLVEASDRQLQLHLDIDPQLPLRVIVDPKRLEQIMTNLISNAIKFTRDGVVKIEASCLTNSPQGAEIRISVSDTGIGIAAKDIDHIFDALHQVDNSGSRAFQGAGLGLAISQRIARLLGSEIKVSSELDKGSTFSFDLHLQQELTDQPGTTQPGATTDPVNLKHRRDHHVNVLLVEDNIVNQMIATKLLENLGCDVDIANDGADAVKMFSQAAYDLIFMDCQMPNMDGFEATTRIREMESEGHIPIIALTANTLPEDRARSFKAGMDEFLTKPVGRDKLQDALDKWATV